MRKFRFSKRIRRIIVGLPLVGVIVLNLLPISTTIRHLLIGITLVWFQVFMLTEVFFPGTTP